jgi:hypothetical protein
VVKRIFSISRDFNFVKKWVAYTGRKLVSSKDCITRNHWSSLQRWIKGEAFVSQFIAGFFFVGFLVAISFSIIVAISENDWSNVGDLLGAVVGIPVALAGSLVAVLLAHRAYIISKRQVQYDSMQYYEPIIEASAKIYLDQTNLLRKLIETLLALRLHLDAIEVALKREKELKGAAYEGGNASSINGLNKKTTEFYVEVENLLSKLADNLADMLRNPICRHMWSNSCSVQDRSVLQVSKYVWNFSQEILIEDLDDISLRECYRIVKFHLAVPKISDL